MAADPRATDIASGTESAPPSSVAVRAPYLPNKPKPTSSTGDYLMAPKKAAADMLAAKAHTISDMLAPRKHPHHELVPATDHHQHHPEGGRLHHHIHPAEGGHHHLMSGVSPFKSHLARKDHHMFSSTEEAILLKHIQSFHAPDGIEYGYDSKYVLNIIEDIILRVSTVIPGVEHRIGLESRLDELHGENLMKGYTLSDLRDELAYPVHKISAELICHCHVEGDGRKITEKIFQSLSAYPWEAKVVITLAAFTMQYGEFWLVAELFRSHPLAGSVSLLMEIPEIMDHMEAFMPKFKAIIDLVDAMLDVTRSIIHFNELLSKHLLPRDTEERLAADLHRTVIQPAAYWTIKSVVACSSILLNLMAMGHEYLTSQVDWELSSLGHKLAQIKGLLREKWRIYQGRVDETLQEEIFILLRNTFRTPHYDNLIVLKRFLNPKDLALPIYDGTEMTKKPLEVLRKKNVILLVSGLDIPAREFEILLQLYQESRMYAEARADSQFEVLWIPIIDRHISAAEDAMLRDEFVTVQQRMPWYSVADPYQIQPGAIRFIREDWKYEHKPLLVVLDPHGRVSNFNAMDMYWIWGFVASPFDEARERELWSQSRWSMDLLLDTIDPTTHSWLTNNKFICVFGGDNIDWIRKFTSIAKSVARQLEIPLELLYVGKDTSEELNRRNNEIIQKENLSTSLPVFHVWFFWERLKCMWNSREKHGLPNVNDAIMQKVISILIYDSSDAPWAVFGRGQFGEMAMNEGEVVLQLFEEFQNWRANISHPNEFVKVLGDLLKDRRPQYRHCWRFVYPGSTARAPAYIEWPEFGKTLQKHLMYDCCTD